MTDIFTADPAPAGEDDDAYLGHVEGETREPAGGAAEQTFDEDGEPIEPAAAGEDEELEDFEEDGKTYKLPKGFKARVMKDADYTQKTQALAAERNQIEEGKKAVLAQATAHRAMLEQVAEVTGLNKQLAAYEAITPEQWAAAHDRDPDETSKARLQMQLLREARDKAVGVLRDKERERLDLGQRETAKAVEQRDAVLARDIKGWTKDSLPKLAKAAAGFGISEAEILATTDPRAIKVLRAAVIGQKTLSQKAATQEIERQQAVTPARKVGSSAPRLGLSDNLSDDEWDRRREAQLAAKRKATGR